MLTNEWVRGSETRANKKEGGVEEKKKLKIGSPHLGMVAKKADGIV